MERKCSVCKEELKNDNFVVLKSGTHVCHSCIVSISDMRVRLEQLGEKGLKLSEKESFNDLKFDAPDHMRPKQIKDILDRYVVGQEAAKKILSVASYNHYKRMVLNETGIKKSNIMLIGPTGSGKTYLVETLAKILNVPLAITPATSLTEAGYIGDDVESCVQRLLEKAGGDVSLAERGIVFIDEIDKLTATSSETKRQVGGKGVQQALLPLLEGTKVSVPASLGDSPFNRGSVPKVEVDTKNILFICGGAFPDAEQIIRNRLSGTKKMGFNTSIEDKSEFDEKNLLLRVNNDDLKEFGLIPELLGRLPVIAPLENLTVDILKKILTEPQDSIVWQYKKLFEYDSVNLVFEDEALQAIAEKAIAKGTGARSLRGILEELLLDLMFEIPSDLEVAEIYITKGYVNGVGGPNYIRRECKSAYTY